MPAAGHARHPTDPAKHSDGRHPPKPSTSTYYPSKRPVLRRPIESKVYFTLFLINPAGMGFGDVKLALTLGAALGWYGWDTILFGGFAGLLLGALYGAGLLLLRRAGRKTAIPYGPFMSGGAVVGVLFGGLAA